MRRIWTGTILAILLLVIAPTTTGDHSFSHRFVVFGTVQFEDGSPAAGYNVTVLHAFDAAVGYCVHQPNSNTTAWGETANRPVTNKHGEFTHCLHTHRMPRDIEYRYTIQVTDPTGQHQLEHVVHVNENKRVNFVHLTVPGTGETELAEFTVAGRLMHDIGDSLVEGVPVQLGVLGNLSVEVSVEGQHSSLSVIDRTNAYGDFAVRVEAPSNFTPVRLVVRAGEWSLMETWPAGRSQHYVSPVWKPESNNELASFLAYESGAALALIIGAAAVLHLRKKWQANRADRAKRTT